MGRAVRFGDSSRNRLSAVEANQQQTSGIYVLPGMPEPPILFPRDKPKRARIGRRYAWAAGITAASLTAAAGGWAILTWPATPPRPVTLVTGLPARAAADIALPVARIEPPVGSRARGVDGVVGDGQTGAQAQARPVDAQIPTATGSAGPGGGRDGPPQRHAAASRSDTQ